MNVYCTSPVVYNCSFEETGQATKHLRDIILHAVFEKRGRGLLREAFQMKASFWGLFKTNFYGCFRKLFLFTKCIIYLVNKNNLRKR